MMAVCGVCILGWLGERMALWAENNCLVERSVYLCLKNLVWNFDRGARLLLCNLLLLLVQQ